MLNPVFLRQAAIAARENERVRVAKQAADQRRLDRMSIAGDLSDIDAPVSKPQAPQCWIDRDGKPYRG
jgi:type II secretory pathway pseudopilin PulG